jgi:hypothetical protein
MTPENQSLFIICTFVAVASLLIGFILGGLFVFMSNLPKRVNKSNKYTGDLK